MGGGQGARTEGPVDEHVALVQLLDDHLPALLLVHEPDHLHRRDVAGDEHALAVHQRHDRRIAPANWLGVVPVRSRSDQYAVA
jgi:hypothetical protein